MADILQALYHTPIGPTAAAGNELGIFEDGGEYYNQEDLNLFFTKLYP